MVPKTRRGQISRTREVSRYLIMYSGYEVWNPNIRLFLFFLSLAASLQINIWWEGGIPSSL